MTAFSKLRKVLLANATFSALCAVVFLAVPGPVAAFVGAPPAEIVSTGVSLAVFVGMLALVITRRTPLPAWALWLAIAIAALDVLWVLTTPLKVMPYSVGGKWLFAIVAVVVADLAFLQIRALPAVFRERRGA